MKKLKVLLVTLLMIISMTTVSFAAGSPTKEPIKIIESDGSHTNQTGIDDDGGLIVTVPGAHDSHHDLEEEADFLVLIRKEIGTFNSHNSISVSEHVAGSANTATTTGTINNKLVSIVEVKTGADKGGLLVKRVPVAEKDITFVKPIEPNIGLDDINNASAYVITSPDVLNNHEAMNEITKVALEENRKVFNYERAVDSDGNVVGVINKDNEVVDVNNKVIANVEEDGSVVDSKGNVIATRQNVVEVSHIIEKAICAIDENHNIHGWYNAEKEAFINDEGEVIGYLVNNYWVEDDGTIIGGTGHYDQYVEYEYNVVDTFDLHYWGNLADKKEPPEEITLYIEGINYGDDIVVHHILNESGKIIIEDAEVVANNAVRLYNLKSFSMFSISKKQKVVYEEELTDVFQPTFGCCCYRVIGGTIIFNILMIIAIIVALVLKRNRDENKYNY